MTKSNQGQYRFEVRKNGERIDGREIDDPFIVTAIENTMTRWAALKTLIRGGFTDTFEVRVNGTHAAHDVVFRGDYTIQGPEVRSDGPGLSIDDEAPDAD